MAKSVRRRAGKSGASRLGRFVAIGLFVVASVTATGAQSGSRLPSPADVAQILGVPAAPAAGQAALRVSPQLPTQPGIPLNMAYNSPMSTAVITSISGQGVNVLGDWDGQEDLVADHALHVGHQVAAGAVITRTAISEHTVANGFPENIYYYGDSIGTVYVVANTNTPTPNVFTVNVPTILNAFGTLNSDSNIVITGLAVSPVVDLTSFALVNGSYAPYNGVVGEILYVAYTDTGGGLRIISNNQLTHSGVLAFPVADMVSAATAAPGIITPTGYPVTMGGSFGVVFSPFWNLAGVAVDDDGSIYLQQVDLVGFTGANIVKVASTGATQYRSTATSGFVTLTTLNPPGGNYPGSNGPLTQINTATNYSGTSSIWGNVTAMAAGPGNVLYLAVSRSFVASDDAATQATEGLFTNPVALGPTPSMIISLADCSGTFDGCTALLPIQDGKAEVAAPGLTLVPGQNNFRVFALGDGPDVRLAPGSSSPVFGTTSDTLKLSFQIDYTIYSGIAVDEEGAVYVVSGGTPVGVGRNPSPGLGEVLLFPDSAPADRRADFIDLRGDVIPTAQGVGGIGDFDSDRFDHIFWQAPLDMETLTPVAVSGLNRGFLLYLNRTRTSDLTPGIPNGAVQADDATSGPVFFGQFDPGHQVGGGDDNNFPFRGDDSDGTGIPVVAGPLEGGFEFNFNAGSGGAQAAYNSFFLNSNGSISFNVGDTTPTPTVAGFLSGPPRIAPAWTNLNPGSRSPAGLNNFPVQAMGFAGINDFKIRWINVPTFGNEACNCRNTFSVSLYDDGEGLDENANQPLNPANPIGNNAVPFDRAEGPTALRWLPNASAQLVGKPARPGGSGYFTFTYGRMDLIGSAAVPAIVGYSAGGLTLGGFGQVTANLSAQATRIGDGTQTAIYEFFNTGTIANPAFDLRFDGNHPALCTPGGQADQDRGLLQFAGMTYLGHVPFSNEPIVPNVTLIKATDISEVRTRISSLRARIPALPPFVYSDTITFGGTMLITPRVINEARQAITDVYIAYGLPAPTFSETLISGVTPIKAIHIQELMNVVGALE